MARMMGIDYGSKRVGVAVTDEAGSIAFPKAVIPNDKFLLMSVVDMISAQKIETVVMGESKDNSGSENEIADAARGFAKMVERETGIIVHFEPEFYSSQEARAHFGGAGPEHIDASAAAIILNSFIHKRESAQHAS